MVGERESLPGKKQANTKLSSFIENHPKISKYRSRSAI